MSAPLDPFLSASLSVSYAGKAPVLNEMFLQLRRGEVLGLAGGSGSGKSTLALALMNLLEDRKAKASGRVYFNGADLLTMKPAELRRLRGRQIALVLQSPAAALNPMLRIATHLREAWKAHAAGDGAREIARALESVRLPSDAAFLKRYPGEISVGQGQRVLIAMAILHSPQLLIADEPTSALDAITQFEVLDLFRSLNRQLGMAVLLISHDLPAIAEVCDRVAVLHAGQIVECGLTAQVMGNPQHWYTQRLMGRVRGGEPRLETKLARHSLLEEYFR